MLWNEKVQLKTFVATPAGGRQVFPSGKAFPCYRKLFGIILIAHKLLFDFYLFIYFPHEWDLILRAQLSL